MSGPSRIAVQPSSTGGEGRAQETIVAISTPPGRGGIGIVRLSGSRALDISSALLRMRHAPVHAEAQVAELIDVAGPDPSAAQRLDEVVVTWFQAPHSYTREDVVEIAAHGSPVVLEYAVRACIERGARLARPGEFTERAFLSGRIDLTQAEAVRDLIEAQTLYQAKVASEQMEGSLSRRVAPIKQALVRLVAELEAGIDFAEDDLDLLPASTIAGRIEEVGSPLRSLAASFEYGRIVRDGFSLAIVGRPNAGKSSLFNRLVQRDRAIVTATPGTTRDPVTENISLGGIPLQLIDTAGLREAENEAESIGIEKSREAFADADVVLLVLDATTDGFTQEEIALLGSLQLRPALVAINKTDLRRDRATLEATERLLKGGAQVLHTSARTGQGIPDLQAAILERIGSKGRETEHGLMTNLRQQQAVSRALSALQSAQSAVKSDVPHEMLLLDMYEALRHLDALTGATTADDILNLIFSTFCIGK